MPKVVELFAGVGGFRVGLNHVQSFDPATGRAVENGNWKFVWANQWEPSKKVQYAFDCYTTRFGKSMLHINKDITLIDKSSIPNHDLLVGGFPCQDYSVARSISNEKGIEGKKGVLWWQIHEILEIKRPNFFFLENVDRLLKSPATQRGRDFAIMLKSLKNLGYVVEWRVVNAADYGMPQRRRRVFIIGYKKSTLKAKEMVDCSIKLQQIESTILNINFPIKIKKVEVLSLEEFKDEVDITESFNYGKFENTGLMVNDKIIQASYEPNYNGHYTTLGDVVNQGSKYTSDYSSYIIPAEDLNKWEIAKGKKSTVRTTSNGYTYRYSEGSMSPVDFLDKPGRTMLTSEGTLNRSSHVIKMSCGKKRTITEIEAELLNTFPANWTNTGMPKRSRYFMMGNALVTEIVSKIEKTLRDEILKEINSSS